MKKQRLPQTGGRIRASAANPAISQNADDNGNSAPSRSVPSAWAASESTLRHLVVSSAAEQTDVIEGSNGPGWVIECDKPAYHKHNDKGLRDRSCGLWSQLRPTCRTGMRNMSNRRSRLTNPRILLRKGLLILVSIYSSSRVHVVIGKMAMQPVLFLTHTTPHTHI